MSTGGSPSDGATTRRAAPDLRSRRLKTTHRLVIGVAGVPSAALVTVGIIVLTTGSAARDVVLGVLIIGMAATVATGVVVSAILLAREAELARLQSEFVSRVSHDLRTPLTSIRLFVETLQLGRARDPRATQECLDALSAETERLLAMVDRLLTWSRIESARRIYTPRRASVAAIVDAALAAFEPMRVQGDDVLVAREVPDRLPDVEVDPDALVEALLNLLQNAYYYTPPSKRIRVAVVVRADTVEFRVADNGPGVAASERSRIFERFYRGAASRALQVRGSGLGLAMVRAVANAHRGSVRVEPNTPAGSVFTIALPIAERPR